MLLRMCMHPNMIKTQQQRKTFLWFYASIAASFYGVSSELCSYAQPNKHQKYFLLSAVLNDESSGNGGSLDGKSWNLISVESRADKPWRAVRLSNQISFHSMLINLWSWSFADEKNMFWCSLGRFYSECLMCFGRSFDGPLRWFSVKIESLTRPHASLRFVFGSEVT